MKLAAAATNAFRPAAALEVLPILRAAHGQKLPANRKRAIAIALLAASAGDVQNAARLAESLGVDDETDRRVVRSRVRAILIGSSCDEAKAVTERWSARFSSQVEALRMQVYAAARCATDTYLKLSDQLIAMGKDEPSDRNDLAWHMTGRGINLPAALDHARNAAERTARGAPMMLNTLAFALAANGEIVEARTAMNDSLKPRGFGSDTILQDSTFLVLGMIAEKVGLKDEAIRLYEHVEKPATNRDIDSTWAIAQIRLTALRGRAG
jgi:hypothetical protein